MIRTYSQYINDYLSADKLQGNPTPGEHHFVATYLVPLLFSVVSKVPAYVNPDGMKDVKGDIVYYSNNAHVLGIEVKLTKTGLSKKEFNNWILDDDHKLWPEIFIGIDTLGLIIAPWSEFREVYVSTLNCDNIVSNLMPIQKSGKYGPSRRLNKLMPLFESKRIFNYQHNTKEALICEDKAVSCLKNLMKPAMLFY